jgi:Calcineurin-like phosphoesterase
VLVADEMAKDYDINAPEKSPAFFFHLGDVIYGQSPGSYLDQFYRPYMHYPGKIIAIPGNHDGDFDSKMVDFQKYFCANSQTVPPIANTILRQTMTQPGVFWFLDAPFLQIVGLYSNAAENPGFISSPQIGQTQKTWLVATLKAIKQTRDAGTRKALLMATHHPPFSAGGHSGSTDMLKDIDDACNKAKIMPDAFFSGHAHSIQRYTRSVSFGGKNLKIPYIVSGCGGHGGQTVDKNVGSVQGDHKYEFGYDGWGYTKADVTSNSLDITSYGLEPAGLKQVDTYSASIA